MRIADALDPHTAYDLVLVTLLAHQVDAVLPALVDSAAACVQFMFNTFVPERLEQALGAERTAFGMPFVQASLDADGRLRASIGAGGQKTKMGHQRWVDVFMAAGLPAALEPNMPLWLRCHAPVCVAFESVSVAVMRRGGGAFWAEADRIAHGVHACFDLVRALGHPLYPAGKRRLHSSPVWVLSAMLWSASRLRSFRELLAGGAPECSALIEVMLDAASRAGSHLDAGKIAAMRPA